MSEITKPTVSVCIPVYNCEKFIGAAIESVLCQSYQDFELIVLNNCSTDSTSSVIRQYSDRRMRVIDQESNIGAAGNWNCALEESSGKYIKLLCADDFIYSDCIARQVRIMEDPLNKSAILTCCRRDVINEQGRRVLSRGFNRLAGLQPGYRAVRETLRAGANFIGETGAVLLRAAALSDQDRFLGDAGYVIDLDLWCRLLLKGDAYVLPESLCAYRVISGSWSMNVMNRQFEDFSHLLERMRAEPRSGLKGYDVTRGKILAYANKNMRALFYSVFNN